MTNEIKPGDTVYFFCIGDLYWDGSKESSISQSTLSEIEKKKLIESLRKSTASKVEEHKILIPTESFGEQWFPRGQVYKTYGAAFAEAYRILSTYNCEYDAYQACDPLHIQSNQFNLTRKNQMTNKNDNSEVEVIGAGDRPEVVEIESDLPEISLCEALIKINLCESIGESIRMMKQDAVKVNGEKIKRPFYLSVENFYDLQVGKKRFKMVKVIRRRSHELNLPDYRYHLSHKEINIGDTVYFYRCCDIPEILAGEVVGFLERRVEKGWVELEIKNKFGETTEELEREASDLYPSYENAFFDLIKTLSDSLVKSGVSLEGIIGKYGDVKLYMDALPIGKPMPRML